ncbi:MAG: hypothetical protein A2X00_12530 [Bacteroidetes bacterium GWE2_32_14]|nr:MAG: hypothetical protein A2X00_12530 [Bacteroidetes bacterium GWE2_32_14]
MKYLVDLRTRYIFANSNFNDRSLSISKSSNIIFFKKILKRFWRLEIKVFIFAPAKRGNKKRITKKGLEKKKEDFLLG